MVELSQRDKTYQKVNEINEMDRLGRSDTHWHSDFQIYASRSHTKILLVRVVFG